MASKKRKAKIQTGLDCGELEWLQESHADAIDDNVKLAEENAELRRDNAHLTEEITRLRRLLGERESPRLDGRRSASTPDDDEPALLTEPGSSAQAAKRTTTSPSPSVPIATSPPAPPSAARTPLAEGPTAIRTEPVQVPPPSPEQIALFRSLFRGREDVYAKRWESQQKGTSGYAPACAMEWKRPHCTKPQKKCSACVYSPITDPVIASHLAGHLTVGVYAMMPEDTCWFLAADFDGDQWSRDASAYLETCRGLGVPAYLERSRSGNGAHVWVFFDIPVLASTARKLGASILTKAMESRHEIKFTTYDRFFPNQDTMPRGGFGNLIALPLQGGSVRKGNAVFLDENLRPYPDQWAALRAIRRVPIERLEDLVGAAERAGVIVGVRLSMTDDEQQDPWTQPPSKRQREKPIPGILPESVKIVQGNMLYLAKADLSSPFLNRVKRLAAFQNPEFYKTQAMRMPTYKTPRVIGCAEDFDRHVGLPRGVLGELRDLLADHRIGLDLSDERFKGRPLDLRFQGELRPEQQAAISELLKHDIGVLSATTAFGKTIVGAWMIAARKVNTLVLVHRQELLQQWRERLSTFLGIPLTAIGQIGGGAKAKPNGLLDIGMIQSLNRNGEVKDIVTDYGHVIVDECHHVAAFSIESILKQVKARYVLGLTATPTRKDGHHPIIIMQCGPIRYRVNPKQQAAERPFDHFVLPRRTAIARPDGDMNYQELCSVLANDADRNDLIIADVARVLDEGRNPLILTERKEHVDVIAAHLTGKADHLITMYGGRTKKEREACIGRLRAIPKSESRILVATGRYIGEGFDDPRLDTLFLALPISWKGTLQQYAGRLHRLYEGKLEVRIYDYVDNNVSMAWAMYEKRKKGYRAIGYAIEPFD